MIDWFLPTTATGAATGTGYHVTITDHGRSGQGGTLVGDTNGIDSRRRVAENTIGILGAFDDRDAVSVGADTTVARNDVSNQAYKGAISSRF